MIKDEIQYNVGNIDRKALIEEFPQMMNRGMGMMKRKQSPLAALEAESRILQSITELARNIKNMEYSISDMDSDRKAKLFNSIKEKLEVLEDVLKELKPEEKKEEENESTLEEGTFTMKDALSKVADGMYNVRVGLGMFRVGKYGKKDPQKRETLIKDVNKGLKEIKERLDKI